MEYEKEVTKKEMSLSSFNCLCGRNVFMVYGNYETFSIYGICVYCGQLMRFEFKLEDKPASK